MAHRHFFSGGGPFVEPLEGRGDAGHEIAGHRGRGIYGGAVRPHRGFNRPVVPQASLG